MFTTLIKGRCKLNICSFHMGTFSQCIRWFSQELKIDNTNDNANHHTHAHMPVMVQEVIQYLKPCPGSIYVDMTFGAGGHSEKLLETASDIKIFALDRDPVAHEFAHKLSKKYPNQVVPLLGKFSDLPYLLSKHKVGKDSVDGFLFDFGCSSMQLDTSERGFSVLLNGPLDMRMDGNRCPENPTVANVLQKIKEEDLAHIIKIYGMEKKAKIIARAVIEARYTFKRLDTTKQLVQLIESVVSGKVTNDKLGNPSLSAKKTFQALRIFVNNELNEVNYGMILAQSYLKIGGRLITISFNSLEDMIVKRHMTGNIQEQVANVLPLKYANYNKTYTSLELENVVHAPWNMIHKHVLTPTSKEIEENPRSRLAKFRAMIKVK